MKTILVTILAGVISLFLFACGGGGSNGSSSPSYTESLLYSFGPDTGTDGQNPEASVIQANDGNFYGTTSAGGTNGTGTVFKITPAGTETVLYSFGPSTGTDGQKPLAGVIQASDGNLYGTTSAGGTNGTGTVFKITPAGAETVLYSFGPGTGTDSQYPAAGIIEASDGNFYGTTWFGGANTTGSVFKITPSGTETVLYSFPEGNGDPVAANGLVQANDGNLYGTTRSGGANNTGVVFKISPSGAETVLYSFGPSSGTDGVGPLAGVIQASDGNFYGTTANGGTNGTGTVFVVTPSGSETVLYSFGRVAFQYAISPTGLIQASDGNFYGTSAGGDNGTGTVFEITPSGAETVLYSFGPSTGTDGVGPLANVIQGSDGNFYGTTWRGGTNGTGTVFKITVNR